MVHQGQSHACAAVGVVAALVERLEHMVDVLGLDARTMVGHAHRITVAQHIDLHPDATVLRRELQSVGEEVAHDLLYVVGHEESV